MVEEGPEVEVAYQFARAAWGKGYATEAARALLDHGFGALGLTRVIGITSPQNLASRRVLEKIGMADQAVGGYFGIEGATVNAAERPGARSGAGGGAARAGVRGLDLGPGALGLPSRDVAVELRVGGRYLNADGDAGRFLTVLPPRRLAFTWENPGHAPGTTVTVDFEAAASGETLVKLQHSAFDGPDAVADLTEGWTGALEALAGWPPRGDGHRPGGYNRPRLGGRSPNPSADPAGEAATWIKDKVV